MRSSRSVVRVLSAALLLAGGLVVLTGGPAGSYVLPTSASGTMLSYASGLTVVGAAEGGGSKTVTLDNLGDGGFGYQADDYTPAVDANTDALELLVPAQPITAGCPNLGLCTDLGTFTFTFSQPVTDPRMHLAELGDTTSQAGARNTTHTRLTVATPGVTATVADGRNLTVSGSTIQLTSATSSADCDNDSTPPGCGTILFTGTFSTLTLNVDSFTAATSGSVTGHAADAFGVTFSVDEDFGDAPATYDAGGAARTLRGDLALGSGLTADNTGTVGATISPNAGATAAGDTDDAFAGATLPTLSSTASSYSLTVPVSGASKAGSVCGWVDFDRDGVFDNPEERSCATFASGATSVPLSWTVPAHGAGTTYVRLRAGYTAATAQVPTGASDSGEVEDYLLAMVGDPLSCADTVYAVRSGSPHDVYSVDTGTGALTSVAQLSTTVNTNALALSSNGRYVYAASGGSVVRYDSQTGVTDTFTGVVGALATHGALDPATGVYYYGGVSSTTDQVSIYGFDTATNTSLGLVAQGIIPDATGGNGDWAFDGQGNLFLIAGAGSSNPLIALGQQLPTTTVGSPVAVTGTLITNVDSSGNAINGMAFSGGFLYLSSSSTLFQANPTTGAVLDTETLNPTGVSVDLASCSTPSTMQVRKNVVSRFAPTDQFTVGVTGGGISTGNTGTTTGTDTGLQTGAGEVGGPVVGQAATTYTITETAAGTTNLANYATSWTCVDAADGNAAVASGSGTSGSFTMPSTGTSAAAVVCTFTNTAAQPSILLDKVAGTPVDVNGNGITDVGDQIPYTFTVTNTGNTSVTGLTVADPKVGDVSCPVSTLAPGGSTTCTAAAYTVLVGDQDAGEVVNTATADGTAAGQPVTDTDSTTTDVVTPDPSVSLDKQAGVPSGTAAGSTITYSFVVTNTGNVPLDAVSVSDGMLGTVTCPAGALAPGAQRTCTAPAYVVTQADVDNGTVQNTATATGTPVGGGSDVTGEDSTTTTLTQVRELVLDKSAGTPVDVNGSGLTDAGDTITYTFTVRNDGNVTMTGIAVTDPLVAPVTCAPLTLAPGQSASCTAPAYVVTEADEVAGSVTNSAHADGVAPGNVAVQSDTDSTVTPVSTPNPSLDMDKDAGTPVDANDSGATDAGDTIQYTFTVTNTGNVPVSAVAIVDDLAGPVTCAPTTLSPGQVAGCTADAPYVITAADEAATVVTNTATATGEDPDGDPVTSDPDSTNTTTAPASAALLLEKFAASPVDVNDSGLTDAGDTIGYVFTVTNDGNVPVHGVGVTDPLAGPVTCAPTTLPPGGSATCAADDDYVVTEADEVAAEVVNVATSGGLDPDGDPVTSNQDSTTTPVDTPAPSLIVEKTAGTPVDANGSGLTDAGDTIQYSFVVTDTGNVPVHGVAIVDPMLGGVTCAPTTLAPGGTAACSADEVYVVTEADEAAGSVDNVAHAEADDPDGGPVVSNTDTTTTPTTVPVTELAFEKTAGPPVDVNASGITDAGDTILYEFTVWNLGNVPVSGVTVDDPLLGGVTCTSMVLQPDESTECVADDVYVVTEADEVSGSVSNTAHGVATDPDDDLVTSPPDSTETPVVEPLPVLSLDKRSGLPADADQSGSIDPGDTIAYTFVLSNDGNVPLDAATVTDPLLGTVSCPQASIPVGGSVTCTGSYSLSKLDVQAGSVLNTAHANAVSPDQDEVISNEDSTTTPMAAEPGLTIRKHGSLVDADGDDVADLGEKVDYSFTVTNTGNVTLSDVAVDDPKAGAVACDDTLLEPGESTGCAADAPYVVKQRDLNAGEVVNVATAIGLSPDDALVRSDPDSVRTAVDTETALRLVKSDVLVDQDGDGKADAGEVIQYSFLVSNTGSATVRRIAIDDPMLSDIVCPMTSLAPGFEMTCTGTYVVSQDDRQAGGTLLNVATAVGDDVVSPQAATRTPVDVLGIEDGTGGDGDGDGDGGDPSVLPDTGGPLRQLPWFGGGLLLLGALMVGWSRREALRASSDSPSPRVQPWPMSSSTRGASGSPPTR